MGREMCVDDKPVRSGTVDIPLSEVVLSTGSAGEQLTSIPHGPTSTRPGVSPLSRGARMKATLSGDPRPNYRAVSWSSPQMLGERRTLCPVDLLYLRATIC